MPREWDGATYDRISAPLTALGRDVVERLTLRGDETVLDAGCGSGRVTELLLERVPRGRVIGVDGSAAMIAAARERLGDRVDLRVADLLELTVDEPVDLVFSTATFHWIADHRRLFERLRAALKDGGRLVAQCGGQGNIAEVRTAVASVAGRPQFAERLQGFDPYNFAGPNETRVLLEQTGFRDVRAWLENRPVVPDEPIEWLATCVVGPQLDRLPEADRRPFLEAVERRLAKPVTIGYVRLNIEATAA